MQTRNIKSLNVLVAEDDKVNQALTKSILKKIDCTYTIVDTGFKILEQLKSSSYDLILMDIEMPDMDGYETTLKIRTELPATISAIPIISISAHMGENEQKKCLEVGMNDYIFKPVRLNELVKKIKQLFPDMAIQETEETVEPAIQTKNEIFNFSALTAACGNNQAVAKNIVRLFITQTPENMRQLKMSLSEEDWPVFKNLCHKMKSAYALLGFSEIKKDLEALEQDCIQENIHVVKFESTLEKLAKENVIITEALEEALKNNN